MAQERGYSGHLPDPGQAVYGISVAAGLAGIGVQTLRLYERHGLLTPARSDGGTRRYSGNDLARLRRITDLVATGSISRGFAAFSTWKTRMPTCTRTTTGSTRTMTGCKRTTSGYGTRATSRTASRRRAIIP